MSWLGFFSLFAALVVIATGIALTDDEGESQVAVPALRFERGAILEPGIRSLAPDAYSFGPLPKRVEVLLDRIPHLNAVDPATAFSDDTVVLIVGPEAFALLPYDFFARQLRTGRAIIAINVPIQALSDATGFTNLAGGPVSPAGEGTFSVGHAAPYYSFVHACGRTLGRGQKLFSSRLFPSDLGHFLDCGLQ